MIVRVLGLATAMLGLTGTVALAEGGDARLTVRRSADALVNPPGPVDANNSPTIARDPTNGARLALAHRVDRPHFGARLYVSEDGGRRWDPRPLPVPDGVDRPYAPDVAFDPNGRLHVLFTSLSGPSNVPDRLWLASSGDGGRTFAPPTTVASGLTFQPRLAVGDDGTLVATFLRATNVGVLQFVGPVAIVAVRSIDGGRTFEGPVAVSDPDRARVGAATPVVAPDGTLHVLYVDYGDDARDFQNLEGPPHDGTFTLVVATSDDGGRSFARGTEVDAGVRTTRRFLAFLPEFPAMAAGPDARLHVAWSDGRDGDDDVFVRTRRGGRWGPPVRLRGATGTGRGDERLVAIDVAPDGRVDVLHLDGETPERATMALAVSTDGGERFRSLAVSATSFDPRVGSSAAPHLPPDLGSRVAVVSDRRGVHAAWTDTRLGSTVSGRQDVVAVRLDVDRGSGHTRRLVGAGLLGLAVVAAVVLVVVTARRRA